jgi:hypothetical protein
VLAFRELNRPVAQAPAPSRPVEQAPAPPDYGGFVRDLAMAIAFGIVVGIPVYLVASQVLSGIAGVLVFLGVFFHRLVLHMFPGAKVPEARAIARRR